MTFSLRITADTRLGLTHVEAAGASELRLPRGCVGTATAIFRRVRDHRARHVLSRSDAAP